MNFLDESGFADSRFPAHDDDGPRRSVLDGGQGCATLREFGPSPDKDRTPAGSRMKPRRRVATEFRQAVAQLPEAAWQALDRIVDGERYASGQQWAEVGDVPNWAGMSKTAPDYRFLAIREPLGELDLGDAEQSPFPTMSFPTLGRYKLFGLVTNRALAGDELIRWQRERCGKSEEAHAVMKDDLAGGRLPSGLFGANAAWWAIMVLAHNLNAMMKRLVLGGDWAARRMKAMRFHLIALPGRVVRHARRLIVRLSAGALDLVRDARAAILSLQPAPSG